MGPVSGKRALSLVPFWYIWRVIKAVLESAPNYGEAVHAAHYGWMAVLFAVLSMLVYIGALMCSHLSAFHIATNIRMGLTHHIAKLPLGKIEQFGTREAAAGHLGDQRRGRDVSCPPAAGSV